MTLEEVRKQIDEIDQKLKELLMKRLDCSYRVVEAKNAKNETAIFRADREEEILGRLGADVPEERKAGYLSVVRKIMETSRMYQYGLLYDWKEGHVVDQLLPEGLEEGGKNVKVLLTRENRPNAMSSILSMIGDYGFNMKQMTLMNEGEKEVTFELIILGDLSTEKMKKLMFQLSGECKEFKILEEGM